MPDYDSYVVATDNPAADPFAILVASVTVGYILVITTC